jgi:hypothetical protein
VVALIFDKIVAELFGKLDKVDKGGEQNQCAGLFRSIEVLGVKVLYLGGLCETAPRDQGMRLGIETGGGGADKWYRIRLLEKAEVYRSCEGALDKLGRRQNM